MNVLINHEKALEEATKWISTKDKIGIYIQKKGLAEFVTLLEEKMDKHEFREILEAFERNVTDSIFDSESKLLGHINFYNFTETIPATTIRLKAGLARRNLTQYLETSLRDYSTDLFNKLCNEYKLPNYDGKNSQNIEILELGWDGDPNGNFEPGSWFDKVFQYDYRKLTQTFYPFVHKILNTGVSFQEWFVIDGMSMLID